MPGVTTVTRHAPNGMVASVDHLASAAGVAMLERGGNAADAAVAASAVMAVVAPHLCGMGGDLFALVHDPRDGGGGPPAALNASGRAGSGADPARLRQEGHDTMPFRGDVRAAPVPGCVDGWLALHSRYGRSPLGVVLGRAMGYATNGFPASPLLASMVEQLHGVAGSEDLSSRPLRPGDLVRRPGLARALDAIIHLGRAGFYQGEFGKGLLSLGGGEFGAADLDQPLADWVVPLGVRVWEHHLWTIPPNSQGYLTLLGAAVAEGLPLPDDPGDPAWVHLLVEAARAAAYDRPAILHEGADVATLLAADEVGRRRGLVNVERRGTLVSPTGMGDTMYLGAIDADRMGVSLIQSNASGFGCGLFEATTGIGLHNRGIGFSLSPGHPAEYGPGRRPPHTLAPALITRADGTLRSVVGTMGGDAQPQILLQVITRFLRHGQSPGAAIGGPRWVLSGGRHGFDTWSDPDAARVAIEASAPPAWEPGLEERGHQVDVVPGVVGTFGHAQLIEVRPDGLAGAADPRSLVGAASGY
jgi:gamma-glutamyltranspeptidase/glutathione hydrolase